MSGSDLTITHTNRCPVLNVITAKPTIIVCGVVACALVALGIVTMIALNNPRGPLKFVANTVGKMGINGTYALMGAGGGVWILTLVLVALRPTPTVVKTIHAKITPETEEPQQSQHPKTDEWREKMRQRYGIGGQSQQ